MASRLALIAVLQGVSIGLLIAVFAWAFYHKVQSMVRFQAVFAAYRLVPGGWVVPGSWLLVLLEGAVLIALVFWPTSGVALALVLLLLYTGAIGALLAQGRKDVDCGCGDTPTPISVGLIVRNLFLIAVASWCLWTRLGTSGLSPQLPWSFLLISGFAVGGLTVMYFAAEQLLANAGFWRRMQNRGEM